MQAPFWDSIEEYHRRGAWIMNKKRITLWLIAGSLGIALVTTVMFQEWDFAKFLTIGIVGIGTKLIESEEKAP
jgi:hypothetical protein